METCVLIPQEFSLAISPAQHKTGVTSRENSVNGSTHTTHGNDPESRKNVNMENGTTILETEVQGKQYTEQMISVWSSVDIPQGTLCHAFQGTVRIGKLDCYDYLNEDDVSRKNITYFFMLIEMHSHTLVHITIVDIRYYYINIL